MPSRQEKIGAVARLEAGDSINEVAKDIGANRRTVTKWRDLLVAARPELFPNLAGGAVGASRDAERASDMAESIKRKQEDVCAKLLDRIDDLIPDTTSVKDLGVVFGIIRDKQIAAAGGNKRDPSMVEDDMDESSMARVAEELRARRLANAPPDVGSGGAQKPQRAIRG